MAEKKPVKSRINIKNIDKAIEKITAEIRKVLVGQDDMVQLIMTAILANGHILLEGVPGIAKTLTAKLISKTLDVGFSRIQFTPDLMPSDIIGTNIYNMKKSAFEFKHGPIFSNTILIDEINRSPAKTQAALFEVMEEKQITVDGKTYTMEKPFIVIATQNPIEYEGTYRLPEAQLDRFLFKINIAYPSPQDELQIIKQTHEQKNADRFEKIKPILKSQHIATLQKIVQSVHIDENLMQYIADIVDKTRNNSSLYLGASPRASIALLEGSKAYAALQGRDFVLPDDIQKLVFPALRHRILLTPEKEMEGLNSDDIIFEILENIEVPR